MIAIGFDIGTSSLKTLVLNDKQQILFEKSKLKLNIILLFNLAMANATKRSFFPTKEKILPQNFFFRKKGKKCLKN